MSRYDNDTFYPGDPVMTEFLSEQELVCKLVHQIRVPEADTDALMDVFKTCRKFFGFGGPKRMKQTLPTLLHRVLSLVPDVRRREQMAASGATQASRNPGFDS